MVSRAFWASQYPQMIRNYHRMMFGYERVVRMKAIYSYRGDFLGWRLVVTNRPLSEHDKHFLRERGLPVPGKFKCPLGRCQERRNQPIRPERQWGYLV